MPQVIHVQEVRTGRAPAIPCASRENAFRVAPSSGALSAYSIAQLVLSTGCGIAEVMRNVDAGTWICPQLGVLCAHIAAADRLSA